MLGLEVLDEVLRQQMPAIRRRIHDDVARCAGDRSVEHDLERLVARLAGVEREVVAEDDETIRAAGATRSAMSGRSTRSALSTSMRRNPLPAYFASIAFTSEDLPVPRDPVSRTLLAGKPRDELPRVPVDDALLVIDGDELVELDRMRMRDCLQIAAARALAPARGSDALPVGIGCGFRKQRLDAREYALRARATGRRAPSSTSVVGVDRHVVVREVARPHRRRRLAAAEVDADRDLLLLHDALAILLAIGGRSTAAIDHEHVVEPERDARRIGVRRLPCCRSRTRCARGWDRTRRTRSSRAANARCRTPRACTRPQSCRLRRESR